MFGAKRKRKNDVAPATPEAAYPDPPAPSKEKVRRPLLLRLFAIKFGGAVRLTILCVVVGIIQKIGWAEKQTREFDMWSTIQQIWENTFHGVVWIVQHGWQPALIGATIVLPIWVIWRLISLPFRR